MFFKYSLAISIIVHSAVIFHFSGITAERADTIKKKPMSVDYVVIKEPQRQPEAATPNLKAKTDLLPPQRIPGNEQNEKKDRKNSVEDTAIKEAKIRSTKDYINYYQFLREKIRRKLKERYRDRYHEGDVCVKFSLRSDGVLLDSNIDEAGSVDDAELRTIAINSIKDASPFRPFPKALSLPSMSFNLTISFKKSLQ